MPKTVEGMVKIISNIQLKKLVFLFFHSPKYATVNPIITINKEASNESKIEVEKVGSKRVNA
jgi:hypothetical protein